MHGKEVLSSSCIRPRFADVRSGQQRARSQFCSARQLLESQRLGRLPSTQTGDTQLLIDCSRLARESAGGIASGQCGRAKLSHNAVGTSGVDPGGKDMSLSARGNDIASPARSHWLVQRRSSSLAWPGPQPLGCSSRAAGGIRCALWLAGMAATVAKLFPNRVGRSTRWLIHGAFDRVDSN